MVFSMTNWHRYSTGTGGGGCDIVFCTVWWWWWCGGVFLEQYTECMHCNLHCTCVVVGGGGGLFARAMAHNILNACIHCIVACTLW